MGLGPKGLFALERLLDHADRRSLGDVLEIDLFEPHPALGAGPVYDPAQPDYLRMNFAAEVLDMWMPRPAGDREDGRLSFVDWRAARGGGEEAYPPRAEVGVYLREGLEQMLAETGTQVRVAVRSTKVRSARRSRTGWRLTGGDGLARVYDEVLLAVGHASGQATPWPHEASLVPSVFPVSRNLSPERVPAGAPVAIRGFALTFIDAALALTEGRGGSFEPEPGHPFRLRYMSSGREAGAILPFSRTGLPMLAKPGPEIASSPGLDEIAAAHRVEILQLSGGFDFGGDFLPLLASHTGSALDAVGGAEGHRAAMEWIASASAGDARVTVSAVEELERSLGVGAGLLPPDLPWALGHSWRVLYPAIVQRFGGAGLDRDAWPSFRRLGAEMERISFGPPPLNAAKLLALIDAGLVVLDCVSGGQLTERAGRTRLGDRDVDVVIDAVLPGPGALRPDAPLRELIDAGHARVMGGRRGLEVAADATCIGRDGTPTRGLAAVGRPSEDCVIGNDTLSRTLHPQGDRWARRIVESADAARAGGPPEGQAVLS